MDIKNILSQLRQRGLSQAAIGQAIGCAQSTISDMEAGRCGVKRPSYKLITGLISLASKHGIETGEEKPVRRRKKVASTTP